MRIVAIADTRTREYELGEVPGGDLLIHAGDMLRKGTALELIRFSEWMRELPHPAKVVVAGNDDRLFFNERESALRILGGHVSYLEDVGVNVHGLTLWGSPWQPEYKGGAFNLPRGIALRDKWALVPEGISLTFGDYSFRSGPGYREAPPPAGGGHDIRRVPILVGILAQHAG